MNTRLCDRMNKWIQDYVIEWTNEYKTRLCDRMNKWIQDYVIEWINEYKTMW